MGTWETKLGLWASIEPRALKRVDTVAACEPLCHRSLGEKAQVCAGCLASRHSNQSAFGHVVHDWPLGEFLRHLLEFHVYHGYCCCCYCCYYV